MQELYWYCLFAAACFIAAAGMLLKERAELALHVLGAAATLATLWMIGR